MGVLEEVDGLGGGQVFVGHWGTGIHGVSFARDVFLDDDGGRKNSLRGEIRGGLCALSDSNPYS